jgi:hypothetical protein
MKSHLQCLHFFTTYEQAIVLNDTRLDRLASNKYSSILGRLQPTKKMKYQHYDSYCTSFSSQLTNWAKKDRELHYAMLERLVNDKYSGLLSPFVTYIENEVLCVRLRRLVL